MDSDIFCALTISNSWQNISQQVALDLNEYIFPWQMCCFEGCLRSGLCCIQVNMVYISGTFTLYMSETNTSVLNSSIFV